MQDSTTPSTLPLSIPLRLLIAFVLGVLAGLVFFFNLQTTPSQGSLLAIPGALFFVAMLLSILFDPAVREGTIAPLRPIIALVLFLLIAAAIVVALAFIPATQAAFTWIALGLLPCAFGLATAFTLGGTGRLGLGVVVALVGWLGSGIPIVLNAVLFYIAYEKTTPGGDGGIALPLTIAYVVIAFALASLGGLVGGLLRTWFVRTPSASPVQP